jgi:protein phosphatase 1G
MLTPAGKQELAALIAGDSDSGFDNMAGCTANFALIKDGFLHVANAGDSRSVLCRNGVAVEMSFDHKPESEIERTRIYKAGGMVTGEGRVNGNLNLSRSLGDFEYKTNHSLPVEEQMITSNPDIKSIQLTPEDEFLFLACDGVWDILSCQEAVDFVRARLGS